MLGQAFWQPGMVRMSVENQTNVRRREIGAERRARTRQKLIEAAARVVAELGERKATIDDFIRAAGVARGTFYNYYSTREELLADLWARVGRNPFLEIQHATAPLSDPAERLACEARLVMARAATDPIWGWLLYATSADAETMPADLLSYPKPDLLIGRRTGRFHFEDLDSASDMVVGTTRTALRAVLHDHRSSVYAQNICVLLLKALGVVDHEARVISAKELPQLIS
jgi:AcrR family transcriptional regulator